jgi:hypothetical protein
MAYLQEYFDFVNDCIRLEFYEPAGLSMFELGNQRIISGSIHTTAKQHFTNIGMSHTSVDLNGEDGALPLDLRQPELFKEFRNRFDVLTNLGTTEHVEPIDNQYECFSIVHDVVRPGGIMIHMVPDVEELDNSGAWKDHCSVYYRKEFFSALADKCNYTILENKVIFGLRSVSMRKETSIAFTTNREIFSLIETR